MIICIALALAAAAGAAGDAAAPLSYRTFATLATVNAANLKQSFANTTAPRHRLVRPAKLCA